MHIPAGPVRLAVALAVAATALAGCSSYGTTSPSRSSAASPAYGAGPSAVNRPAPRSAPGSTTEASATEAGGVSRCTTAGLRAGLAPGSPGAGQRYATLTLTNTSGRPCTVRGYGGLGLVGAGGVPLPTRQVRVSSPPPRTVVVRPGTAVSALLHWSAVPGAGDTTPGNCQPVPAMLRVIPPDETTALSVPWTQGPVCEGGRIDQQAYAG